MGHNPNDLVRFFRTLEHECGYYADRVAQDLVIDPQEPRLGALFNQALYMGFRRSGNLVYRPDCATCNACVPLRIDVQAFIPNRTQRKILNRSAHITMEPCPPQRTDEQFELYRKYLKARHTDAGMDDHEPTDYDEFLSSDWSTTHFLEFRENGQLIAVAVTDEVAEGISAVYTFYDPEHAQRSLGTLSVLRQVQWARDLNKSYVYMGYWIEGHPKMDYKRKFHGAQRLIDPTWQPMNDPE